MKFKKNLSDQALTITIKRGFEKNLVDTRNHGNVEFKIPDVAQAALAMFRFKYPGMLPFDKDLRTNIDQTKAANLRNLYGVQSVPSDTQMRTLLDPVPPESFRPIFTEMFRLLQDAKVTSKFKFYEGKLLLSLDGTGYFSSSTVNCPQCCQKNHKDGSTTYYHQALMGAFVHPDIKVVIPVFPEPIIVQDGQAKNDCERNAAERFLQKFRQDHPTLRVIVTEDGLASNGPHIKKLKQLNFNFILGAKPGDHKTLYENLAIKDAENRLKMLVASQKNGDIYTYRWVNQVALNASHLGVLINWLELTITHKNGKVTVFSWVTDLSLHETTVETIALGGRTRWKIENETFNTLKNQGYNLEHNFGHGAMNLSVNLMLIMLLAFLVDQIVALTDESFQGVRDRCSSMRATWERLRGIFSLTVVQDWRDFYNKALYGIKSLDETKPIFEIRSIPPPNTTLSMAT